MPFVMADGFRSEMAADCPSSRHLLQDFKCESAAECAVWVHCVSSQTRWAFSTLARPALICPCRSARRTEAAAPRLRQWRSPGRWRLVFCREGSPFCRSRPALSRQAARRGQWSFGWRKAVGKCVLGVYAARLPCIFRIRRGLPEKAAALWGLAALPQQAFQPLLEHEKHPLHRFRRFQRRKNNARKRLIFKAQADPAPDGRAQHLRTHTEAIFLRRLRLHGNAMFRQQRFHFPARAAIGNERLRAVQHNAIGQIPHVPLPSLSS